MNQICEQLQDMGFPRFEQSQLQTIVLQPGAAPRVVSVDRWDFLDRDRTSGVVLTREFVLLQTRPYEVFEEFAATFRTVLDVIGEIAGPKLVERVGLRYVNLIRLADGETTAKYLEPGLAGYSAAAVPELKVAYTRSRMETLVAMESSSLSIRCFDRDDGAFLPPDLWPSVLDHQIEVAKGERVTILDLDHSAGQAIDYDVDELMLTLHALHDATDIAFRGAVTPYALMKWEQEFLE